MPDRRRRRDRLELWVGIFGILLMLFATIRVQLQGDKLDDQQAQLRHLAVQVSSASQQLGNEYTFAIEACNRLQILRVQDNISHYADWKVFSVVSVEQHAAIQAGRLPASQRADAGRFLRELDSAVRAKTWVPVTNCASAVNREGISYRPPRPVPFSVRLPPKSALTLPPRTFDGR